MVPLPPGGPEAAASGMTDPRPTGETRSGHPGDVRSCSASPAARPGDHRVLRRGARRRDQAAGRCRARRALGRGANRHGPAGPLGYWRSRGRAVRYERPDMLGRWSYRWRFSMALIQSLFASIHDDEEGQGLAEYALILALIAIVAIVALIFLGGRSPTSCSTSATRSSRHRDPARGRRLCPAASSIPGRRRRSVTRRHRSCRHDQLTPARARLPSLPRIAWTTNERR